VASVEGVNTLTDAARASVDQSTGMLRIAELMMLLLAVLIGFNSTGISAEERAREHATMFAFGLPARTVVRMSIVENAIMGALGTLVGAAIGFAVLRWIAGTIWPRVIPDLGIVTDISTGSLLTAAVVGVGAMALSPVLTIRRLRHLDLPATLRVVE
jgi:putative ABC transport system permease protein